MLARDRSAAPHRHAAVWPIHRPASSPRATGARPRRPQAVRSAATARSWPCSMPDQRPGARHRAHRRRGSTPPGTIHGMRLAIASRGGDGVLTAVRHETPRGRPAGRAVRWRPSAARAPWRSMSTRIACSWSPRASGRRRRRQPSIRSHGRRSCPAHSGCWWSSRRNPLSDRRPHPARPPSGALLLAVVSLATGGCCGSKQMPRPPPPTRWHASCLPQLIAINTTDTARGNVTTAAEAMAQRLRTAGFPAADIQVLGPSERKKNLVVRLRGAARHKPVLLIGHLDVVEARREDWSTPILSSCWRRTATSTAVARST